MKSFALWAGLVVAFTVPVRSQVTVEVKLEQEQFLPGESLTAAVRITNRSGQTLRLGEENDWLTFSVESREGAVIAKNAEAAVVGPFTLETSKRAIKRVDLESCFGLTEPGRYSIVATVRIKEWDHQVNSPPTSFNIIEGAKLWEQAFGLPHSHPSQTNATPEVRKYILQQANYLKGQIRLYLRLTDASGGKAFRVLPIGQLVSFSRPDPQIDRFSNLHVLYANGPHSYSYSVFDPDGELLTRETYDYVGTRPRLHPDEEGNVKVAGGVRRAPRNESPDLKPELPPETGRPSKP
jgi:hypothetical protein